MFSFGKRKIFLTILIILFMGLCGWFWRHRESVPFVSQPLSTAAAPFEYGMSRIAFAGRTGIGMIDQILSDWEELEALRRENGALRAEQTAYSGILAENIRLRELAGFRQGYKQFTLLGASVIDRDYGSWSDTMVIDRGTDSGIAKYMPVIVPGGLVGFVSDVYLNSARVQLITDPRTSVGAVVQRPGSRVDSIVRGNGNRPAQMIFTNLIREADILKGDMLVTSGYGGVYPPGLLIGTVDSVTGGESDTIRSAVVTPAADMGRLEEVFVITSQFERTLPQNIEMTAPTKEPVMNPNEKQAGVS